MNFGRNFTERCRAPQWESPPGLDGVVANPARFQTCSRSGGITGINDGITKCYSFTHLLPTVKKPIELKNVYEDLINISHQWYDLGLQLELEEGTLKTIKSDNPESQHCLRETLSTWLKTDPRPSWQTLCAALRSRTVGAEKLAGDLEAKYE